MLQARKFTTTLPFKLNRIFLATIVAAAVTTAACNDDDPTQPPPSNIVDFGGPMSGASEVPTNTTTGTGTFTATLDTSTNVFTYDLTFTGLTSNVENGHIHGPAAEGVNADPVVDFKTLAGATFTTGATAGSGHGTILLTAATQITPTINGDSLKTLLLAGKTYLNIHTVNNPNGEIRGQITKE